jgi:hypothetical protein
VINDNNQRLKNAGRCLAHRSESSVTEKKPIRTPSFYRFRLRPAIIPESYFEAKQKNEKTALWLALPAVRSSQMRGFLVYRFYMLYDQLYETFEII